MLHRLAISCCQCATIIVRVTLCDSVKFYYKPHCLRVKKKAICFFGFHFVVLMCPQKMLVSRSKGAKQAGSPYKTGVI